MVTCPSIDTPLVHPSLLGCVPLNTCDLNVIYDNGESGEPISYEAHATINKTFNIMSQSLTTRTCHTIRILHLTSSEVGHHYHDHQSHNNQMLHVLLVEVKKWKFIYFNSIIIHCQIAMHVYIGIMASILRQSSVNRTLLHVLTVYGVKLLYHFCSFDS